MCVCVCVCARALLAVFILANVYVTELKSANLIYFVAILSYLILELTLKPYQLWQSGVLGVVCLCSLAIITAVEMGNSGIQQVSGSLPIYDLVYVELVCFFLPVLALCLLGVQMYWRYVIGECPAPPTVNRVQPAHSRSVMA